MLLKCSEKTYQVLRHDQTRLAGRLQREPGPFFLQVDLAIQKNSSGEINGDIRSIRGREAYYNITKQPGNGRVFVRIERIAEAVYTHHTLYTLNTLYTLYTHNTLYTLNTLNIQITLVSKLGIASCPQQASVSSFLAMTVSKHRPVLQLLFRSSLNLPTHNQPVNYPK